MFAPVYDTGWSVIYIFLGLTTVLLIAIPLTLLSEALVLRWYLSKGETPFKFWPALGASFLANAASGILGFIALTIFGPILGRQWQPEAPSTLVVVLQFLLALFGTSVLSVFIEIFPLLLFVKGKRALIASLWANAASFVVCALMGIIVLFVL